MQGAPRRINQHRDVFADRRTRRTRTRTAEQDAAIAEYLDDEDRDLIALSRRYRTDLRPA